MCYKKLSKNNNSNNSEFKCNISSSSSNNNNNDAFIAQRRSRRRTFSENLIEEEQALAKVLDHPDCRQHFYTAFCNSEIGCGLYTSKCIKKGDVVIEFKGQLITRSEGLRVERFLETQEPSPKNATYVIFFDFPIGGRAHAFLVDTHDLSYFLNHSHLNPNIVPKALSVNGKIRLYFVAIKDIGIHEQLFYDYGDNQGESLRNFPWLKTT